MGVNFLVDVVELKYVKKFLTKSTVHTLNYYDITFITEGKGAFAVDNQTYEAIPCDVLFSKPGGNPELGYSSYHQWVCSDFRRRVFVFPL